MEFNTPGSNKTGITPEFKEYVAEWQLSNIEKLLDAKVERCHVHNSDNRDEVYNQITITYKVEDNQ
jgi:hypothetical protein